MASAAMYEGVGAAPKHVMKLTCTLCSSSRAAGARALIFTGRGWLLASATVEAKRSRLPQLCSGMTSGSALTLYSYFLRVNNREVDKFSTVSEDRDALSPAP